MSSGSVLQEPTPCTCGGVVGVVALRFGQGAASERKLSVGQRASKCSHCGSERATTATEAEREQEAGLCFAWLAYGPICRTGVTAALGGSAGSVAARKGELPKGLPTAQPADRFDCCVGGSALPDPEDIPEGDLELSMEQLER
jgi:hypothetical protein